MSIKFINKDGEFRVSQAFDSPAIYMDHWAIRKFTDDCAIQNRLVKSIKEKNGTLILSNFSILEFAGPIDPRHCAETEKFLDRVTPNFYFADFRPDELFSRERKENSNQNRFWPSGDYLTLKYLAERRSSHDSDISFKGFLTEIHDNREFLNKIKSEVASDIKVALESNRNNPAYTKKAKQAIPSNDRVRIFNIFGELIRGFNVDLSSPISENDAVDLVHTVISLNCCDFILVDGPWEERIKKMCLRISKTDMVMPIAKYFSQRNNGIENFLVAIESFDPKQKRSSALPL